MALNRRPAAPDYSKPGETFPNQPVHQFPPRHFVTGQGPILLRPAPFDHAPIDRIDLNAHILASVPEPTDQLGCEIPDDYRRLVARDASALPEVRDLVRLLDHATDALEELRQKRRAFPLGSFASSTLGTLKRKRDVLRAAADATDAALEILEARLNSLAAVIAPAD